MNKVHVSKGVRIFWSTLFVVGLVALGAGVVFLLSGPEMIILTVLFGGTGAFIVVESLGRMLKWEK